METDHRISWHPFHCETFSINTVAAYSVYFSPSVETCNCHGSRLYMLHPYASLPRDETLLLLFREKRSTYYVAIKRKYSLMMRLRLLF